MMLGKAVSKHLVASGGTTEILVRDKILLYLEGKGVACDFNVVFRARKRQLPISFTLVVNVKEPLSASTSFYSRTTSG
jgi:hypothetical protein